MALRKVGYIASKCIDKFHLLHYLFFGSCQSLLATLLPWSLTHPKAVCGLPCRQKTCGCGRMASSRSFSEEQFQEACAELQNPELLGWNRQMESRGLTIYRKLNKVWFHLLEAAAGAPHRGHWEAAACPDPRGLLEPGGISTGVVPPAYFAAFGS